METGTNGPVDGSAGQSVNAPSATEASTAISSLANFRARQAASTPAGQAQSQGGAVGPNTDATPRPEREPYIPRERFDEVNTRLKSEVQELRDQLTALTQRAQFGPAPQQVPQNVSPTGMVGAQPRPQSSVPDFNDPQVKQQWKDRLYKDPVGGMAELVDTLIQARGAPMLEQFQQSILGQLQPIRQSFTASQVQSYEASRASDATFAAVRPTFNALVGQAVQQGLALNTQTLQAIEGIARAQAGVPLVTAPAPQANAPFSEQPGGQGHTEQPITLTSQQREYAARFGMTEQQYAAKLKALGIS